jgi:hypothetical protein
MNNLKIINTIKRMKTGYEKENSMEKFPDASDRISDIQLYQSDTEAGFLVSAPKCRINGRTGAAAL